MPTPTGRNRLFDLFLKGAGPALRGDEPAQTGGILPLARYNNGGVFPAVPDVLTALVQSAQRGPHLDYMHPDPEVRHANTQQGVMDAFNVAGAAATGGIAMPRPIGSVGSGGFPKSGLKPLSQLLAEMGNGVSSNESVREGLMRTVLETEKLSANLSKEQKAKMLRESDDILDAVRRQMRQRRKDLGGGSEP